MRMIYKSLLKYVVKLITKRNIVLNFYQKYHCILICMFVAKKKN